jgi:TatD DNase family protein
MITDTHVHLDVKQIYSNVDFVLKSARDKGVNRFIIPAIRINDMERIIEIVDKNDDVFFSTGNHPNSLDCYNLKTIEEYISHEKCIAVGECGLDWFRIPNGAKIEEVKQYQIKCFSEQLELAIKYKKPVILHSRDTDEDMVEVVSKYGNDLVGGVIHCYVGSDKLLELQKYNFYYGIGGVSTYKSATDLHRNLKRLSIDRIIIETDAPYLTPEPFRKETNKPEYTREVLKRIVELKGGNSNYLESKIEENVNRLFFNKK